jgi:hypothetical protein
MDQLVFKSSDHFGPISDDLLDESMEAARAGAVPVEREVL